MDDPKEPQTIQESLDAVHAAFVALGAAIADELLPVVQRLSELRQPPPPEPTRLMRASDWLGAHWMILLVALHFLLIAVVGILALVGL